MPQGAPRDDTGVASTIATLFTLLIALVFIEAAMIAPIPRQQYDAEWTTSQEALEAFGMLRALLAGPATRGSMFTVPIKLGTYPVSPIAGGSPGRLEMDTSVPGPTISFRFVPNFHRAQVTKVDQDVILLMDSSGSMVWNDPLRQRISGAKEYVGQLRRPDRVAIVDFDSVARFTWANVGGPVHHLFAAGHDGNPDYSEAQSDLNTIDSRGGTNFGDAIRIANDEFVAYGNPKHAWIMILLTDGQNSQRWMNDLARAQAQRAKALGAVIYTIGLGREPDAALLTEIATTTGGTYYAAPDPASLRWIYLEISRRYSASFTCGSFSSADVSLGLLSLRLQTREYPSQTIRLEAGGIAIVQASGSVVREGTPFLYEHSAPNAGTLTLSIPTFIGAPLSASGVDYEIVHARVEAVDLVEQRITRVDLAQEAGLIGNISANVQYWADQGAATPAAAQAVRAPIEGARAFILGAAGDFESGDLASAKFNVDRAQAQMSAAIAETDRQVTAGQMQTWLGAQTKDDMLLSACRLDQWRNWYDGLTIDIASPSAPGWARWFNETFRALGAPVDVGVSGDHAVISLRAIDNFVLDRRIVRIWFGE